jgi:hypothetical protein
MNGRWADQPIHNGPVAAHAVRRVQKPRMGRSIEEECGVGAIVSRIGLLFEGAIGSPAGPAGPAGAEVEAVLADGYACLLALEAERARIARRSSELFAAGGAVRSVARELRGLNARLLAHDLEIARLRSVLTELRDCAPQTEVAS